MVRISCFDSGGQSLFVAWNDDTCGHLTSLSSVEDAWIRLLSYFWPTLLLLLICVIWCFLELLLIWKVECVSVTRHDFIDCMAKFSTFQPQCRLANLTSEHDRCILFLHDLLQAWWIKTLISSSTNFHVFCELLFIYLWAILVKLILKILLFQDWLWNS